MRHDSSKFFQRFRRWTFTGVPCVLRCGWQLGVEYCDDDPPELLPDVVRMSLGEIHGDPNVTF